MALSSSNLNTEFQHQQRIRKGQLVDPLGCWVGYAGDIVLLFEDITNLELVLNVSCTTSKRYHVEIVILKTKRMIFNHQYINEEYPKTIVSIYNTPVENTIIFKYLGCSIKYDEPSTRDSELEMCIDTTLCKFYWWASKWCSLQALESWMPSCMVD